MYYHDRRSRNTDFVLMALAALSLAWALLWHGIDAVELATGPYAAVVGEFVAMVACVVLVVRSRLQVRDADAERDRALEELEESRKDPAVVPVRDELEKLATKVRGIQKCDGGGTVQACGRADKERESVAARVRELLGEDAEGEFRQCSQVVKGLRRAEWDRYWGDHAKWLESKSAALQPRDITTEWRLKTR